MAAEAPNDKERRPPLAADASRRSSKLSYAGAALIAAAAVFWALSPSGGDGPPMGGIAPDFQAADLSGKPLRLSDFRGKVVLLDFWAPWCSTCVEEIPSLQRIYGDLGSRGFELLAASVDDDGPGAVAGFVRSHGLRYRVFRADAALARDYRVWGLPTKYLISPDGIIHRRYLGDEDPLQLEADIMKLMDNKEKP